MEINDAIAKRELGFSFPLDDTKKRQREYNRIIGLFEDDLRKQGLSDLTIQRHTDRIDLFLNAFLAYNHSSSVRHASGFPGEYFGRFLIRYVRSADLIKTHASSVRKFYKWLAQNGAITQEEYKRFYQIVKDKMDTWQNTFFRYYCYQ